MNPRLICLLLITSFTSCSIVSKQYYYLPDPPRPIVKDHSSYIKMILPQFTITDTSGKTLANLATSNGIGIPLFAGPPYIPVLPVAIVSVFYKQIHYFVMDLRITGSDANLAKLAIDTNNCYMLVDGTKKILLKAHQLLMDRPGEYDYRLSVPIRYAKIRSLTISTGNPLLDRSLNNVIFHRKKRLTHSIIGPS
ncbi:MAG TPA: hypothetical protein VGN00_20890 [Puia sp.]